MRQSHILRNTGHVLADFCFIVTISRDQRPWLRYALCWMPFYYLYVFSVIHSFMTTHLTPCQKRIMHARSGGWADLYVAFYWYIGRHATYVLLKTPVLHLHGLQDHRIKTPQEVMTPWPSKLVIGIASNALQIIYTLRCFPEPCS